MSKSWICGLAVLVAMPVIAKPKPPAGALTFKPSKEEASERPQVTAATIKPQGTNFVLRVTFNKLPWGSECKTRCGNAMFLIDTDGDKETGMQQGPGKKTTGADLAVSVQGLQDYGGVSAAGYLKAKVRQLGDDDRVVEDGDVIQEFDHRTDRDRLEPEGNEVTVVIDGSSATIPSGKTCRLVYIPSGSPPVETPCKGLGEPQSASSNVQVMRGPKGSSGSGKVYKGAPAGGASDKQYVAPSGGGSAYDPNEKHPYGEGG